MAVLDTKLHVKKDGVTHECTIYTTASEATPTGGAVWEVKIYNAGGGETTGYIGLYPGENAGPYPAALPRKQDGIIYTVQSQVVNMVTVTIIQPDHGVITVTVDGVSHTSTFDTPYGSIGIFFYDSANSGYKFVRWNLPEWAMMNIIASDLTVSAEVLNV